MNTDNITITQAITMTTTAITYLTNLQNIGIETIIAGSRQWSVQAVLAEMRGSLLTLQYAQTTYGGTATAVEAGPSLGAVISVVAWWAAAFTAVAGAVYVVVLVGQLIYYNYNTADDISFVGNSYTDAALACWDDLWACISGGTPN